MKEIGKKKSCSFANLLGWVATERCSPAMAARFPPALQASHRPAIGLPGGFTLSCLPMLSRAKNLQGSAKSWPYSDFANDRSPLSRQKDFLHVYVTNTTKMKHLHEVKGFVILKRLCHFRILVMLHDQSC